MKLTPRTRLVALVVLLVLLLIGAQYIFQAVRPRPAPDLPPSPTSPGIEEGQATFEAATGPIEVVAAKAIWLDAQTIAWSGSPGSSYKLLYDPDGGVTSAAELSPCALPIATATAVPAATVAADANAATPATATAVATPCSVPLTAEGAVSGYPKNPNAAGLTRLVAGLSAEDAKHLLKGQVVVASYDGAARLDTSAVQVQGVLDALYAVNARAERLGVTYAADGGDALTVRVWAPTAVSVTLKRYATPTGAEVGSHPMTPDPASGVWRVSGDASWDRQFYLFDVEVYVPGAGRLIHNLVTDPYAANLSADTSFAGDPRSQFVDLAAADLKPEGWDMLAKPDLAAPEDIVIYETHIRDFSINDATVAQADRGTYRAFTYDGARPHPNTALSDGMTHLLELQEAGLTHVHLLPAFDIASVIEPGGQRTEPVVQAAARNSQVQQAAVAATRGRDGFNWGYDPYHYGAVEGSYSTKPDGVARIVEFRDMVAGLNRNGLRVVMDVVYNHTAASGQDDRSVLDKVVPGYYYRYTADGALYTDSCCSDTASEYDMVEKLVIDTVTRWAVDYKVDGFRFDLMNFHTRRNMENIQAAVEGLTEAEHGVDGREIYLYGEGWDFGSALAKGFTDCTGGWCYAGKWNMTGSGTGAFNDIIRDAAHGGYSQDPVGIRRQGFINGLSYDWNGYAYDQRGQADLWAATDRLRSALRGSGTDWNGQGTPFTGDPQEAVNYIEKHDNETLFDQNVFKLPHGDGSGNPGWTGSGIPVTTMAERVRSQNMGISLVGLAQGIPFFHMGGELLRSKSLDRNSYDSGDWFNRVHWDGSSNNFGVGLPPAWDNQGRWEIMAPLLADARLDPAQADLEFAAGHLREILRIRKSSRLFRLASEDDVNARTWFYDTGHDGLIVMALSDAPEPDLEARAETILVFFNANKVEQTVAIRGASGFTLHPLQADALDADPVVQAATFDDAAGAFAIPARTTAVFVSAQPLARPLPSSTLDWVGDMFPAGGAANEVTQGAADRALDVYVQVYEPGVTEAAGEAAGVSCSLHWGAYGSAWTDLPMAWNAQKGNNDEYRATLTQELLDTLAPGTYGFTASCRREGEDPLWRQEPGGDGLLTVLPAADASPAPEGGVFVHLFEWRWADIEKECPYLAQKGYAAVQVSPPQEHIVPTANMGGVETNDYPWWVRYQPVSHDVSRFTSRSGSWEEFQSMVLACKSVGVGIYVDAVINHMAAMEVGTPPRGTAGTEYDTDAATRFYGTQYGADDFHPDCTIRNYGDRTEVQTCALSGLPDLNTGKPDVQAEMGGYLQALLDAGVTGFRIDGGKHMPAQDIAAILGGLEGRFYVFQETIDQSSAEPVRDWEYAAVGDVTEFSYAFALGTAFDDACGGRLSDLQNRFSQGDMLPSRFAQVFTDNHDNQRGHGVGSGCVVDHRDGQEHVLANIFALAYPYGYPSVISSYYWQASAVDDTGDSLGPPSSGDGGATWGAGLGAETRPVYGPDQAAGDIPANCAATYEDGKWACEHRRTSTANMVAFRKATAGEAIRDWQNIGGIPSDHIAFGLGEKGFVAINGTSQDAANVTYTTALPDGAYCNVVHYDFSATAGRCVDPATGLAAPPESLIAVSGGQIVATLPAMDAFAIHVAARN